MLSYFISVQYGVIVLRETPPMQLFLRESRQLPPLSEHFIVHRAANRLCFVKNCKDRAPQIAKWRFGLRTGRTPAIIDTLETA
ncbi:hypothetical protein HMPREF0262_01479 [Clostridium sp. ATCC 29733]|nr:hypothetical protein HMPREF0262_01479 [Clostridium sp. ATCC 29733]